LQGLQDLDRTVALVEREVHLREQVEVWIEGVDAGPEIHLSAGQRP
jgi:hypothetical protein